MPVTGIEQVEVTRGRWTLVGGALDETLLGSTTRGAHVDIHAGGGRDVLGGHVAGRPARRRTAASTRCWRPPATTAASPSNA